MKKLIKKYSTILFYVFFFVVFITNNIQLESFSKKIEDEIILPYTQRFQDIEKPRFNQNPISSNHEVTTDSAKSPIVTVEPTLVPEVTIIYITPTPVSVMITEDDLWNALTDYRADHGKSSIQRSEALCTYARSRASELSKRLSTNLDDPLDGHAGFTRDADSGNLFEVTGFNTIGENLAYTPGYTTATQIIEWGWDTSPAHRSLQLSDDITHGCLSGIYPIYVGIYTY